MHRRTVLLTATGALAGASAACATGSGSDETIPVGEDSLTIASINWDEAIVVTELWRQALTAAGWTVNVVEYDDAAPLFRDLANGDVDFFLDGWLPSTHADYMEKHGDSIDNLSFWYDNGSLAIAVPDYVTDINAIDELDSYADLLDGTVTGIEPGAGLTAAVRNEVIPTYNLTEVELKTSSTPEMLSDLRAATESQEAIAVTLWHPHWAYTAFNMRDLIDPYDTLNSVETLHILTRSGFASDQPDLAEALRLFTMSNEQLADLENFALNESEDVSQAVSTWMQDNPMDSMMEPPSS